MRMVCVMKLCPNFKTGPKQDKTLRLHVFPKDPQLRREWEDWILENHGMIRGEIDFKPRHGLCSAHFTQDSYLPYLDQKKFLKVDAKPSIAPELTADYAFKRNLISKREDFPEFLAQKQINGVPRRQDSPDPDDPPILQEVAVNVSIDSTANENENPLAVHQLCAEPCGVGQVNADDRFELHRRKRRRLNDKENASPLLAQDVAKAATSSVVQEEGGSLLEGDESAESSDSDSDSSVSGGRLNSSEEDADTSLGDVDVSLEEPGNNAVGTPPFTQRQKRKRVAYLGDITVERQWTPRSSSKALQVIRKAAEQGRKERHNGRRRIRRVQTKVKNLKCLVKRLTKETNMPLELGKLLQEKFDGPTAALLTSVINGSKLGRKGGQYEPAVRQFSLTLNYHSPAAYRYVRTNLLGKNLPHPRTLSKWYSVVDAKPGFSEESKVTIKIQVELMKKKGHTLRLALSHDDMSIRQQSTYRNDGTVEGFGYDGYNEEVTVDGSDLAKHVWVIMCTAINGDWKLPIAYFFHAKMDAAVRSNLIKRCLEWLYDTGAIVDTMTFDGTVSNICTAETLGSKLQPDRNWAPYFSHPVKPKPGETEMPPIYVIMDAAHMIKLWRNVFGRGYGLQDSAERNISFDFVKKLHQLQEREGLRAGNKLTNNHINFQGQKMKVRLATQLLSASVADAIDFCRDELHLPEFRGSEGTVQFIRMANTLFDIQNSTNIWTRDPYKKAMGTDNIVKIRQQFAEAREYIRGLKIKGPKDVIFSPLLNHRLHTGFTGFLVNMDSLEGLYDRLLAGEKPILKFLPSYKLSQDHLEMFFGAVRSKGRNNNNPSTSQFTSAYKRLLVHVQLKDEKRGGNCWPLECVAILHVSAKSAVSRDMEVADEDLVKNCDHNYARALGRNGIRLSTFVGDVVEYIAGFVVRKVNKQHGCGECSHVLFGQFKQRLIRQKDRGGLQTPSADVLKICRKAESQIRSCAQDRTFLTTKRDVHVNRIFREVVGESPTIFESLDEHVSHQAPLENHKFALLKLVITKYIIVRMCWDVKKLNSMYIKEGLRATCTKSVLFQHQ